MNIQVGDKIRVPAEFGTSHYGMYVGSAGGAWRGVVHNDKRLGRVVLVELEEFLAGRIPVVETRVLGGWSSQGEAVARALALIGRAYDLVNFNCEHAATFAQTGEARSGQIQALGVVVLLVACVVVFSRA